jgi:general secretion pathway protein J
MQTSCFRSHTGFTLLEVLLAMSLLSIMVVLLFSSLRTGAQSWQRGEVKIAQVNEKAVVYQFFKRHIPTIKPLWDDFSDDEKVFAFQGTKKSMRFVSVFPASAARKGFQLFTVEMDKVDRQTILVKVAPFYLQQDDQPWEQEEVILLENVDEFQFAYFDKGEDNDEAVWMESWQEKEYLPALIKIRVSLTDQSFWPDMVFALPMAMKTANDADDWDDEDAAAREEAAAREAGLRDEGR